MHSGRKTRPKADKDALPPHSEEAEKGVLGCLLTEPEKCIYKTLEVFPLEGTFFYDGRHEAIYECILDLFNVGISVDLVTVSAKLRERNMLEEVGGLSVLSNLSDSSIVAHLEDYLGVLKEKWLLRQVIKAAVIITTKAQDEQPSATVIEQAQSDYLRIGREMIGQPVVSLAQHMKSAMQKLQIMSIGDRTAIGLQTGFNTIDGMTGGLQPGQLAILAARPSIGKSALALNIAVNVAKAGTGVLFFSLEMSAEMLTMRMIASESEVNLKHVIDGAATQQEMKRVIGSGKTLSNLPLHIDEDGDVNIVQMRSRAAQYQAEKKIGLVIVDYVQLVHGSKSTDRRVEEVSEVSRGLKAIAKSLKVPLLALSALSRLQDKEKGRSPRMSDLRDTSALEHDADIILLMHRPTGEDEEHTHVPGQPYPVTFNLAKQRGGPTGEFNLLFHSGITTFRDPEPERAADQMGLPSI